jgi:sec-independent protein translocase protein TatA
MAPLASFIRRAETLDSLAAKHPGRPMIGAGHGRRQMLNNIGLPGLLLIAVVVLVLFGRGKISSLMGEVGKGITSFKKGINEGQAELENEAADAAEAAKDITPAKDKDKV